MSLYMSITVKYKTTLKLCVTVLTHAITMYVRNYIYVYNIAAMFNLAELMFGELLNKNRLAKSLANG